MTSKAVSLDPGSARRGNYVQFRIANKTVTRRTFSVAGRKVVIPAHRVRLIAIQFFARGRYRYVSGGASTVRGIFRVS